ncbi:MAG: hypothetical protein K2N94_00725 [Lachnospiraceae bacterium]|nr:hypothetical protein [Lachnospiraceae bacterium]
MTVEEFEQRTGYYPSCKEYAAIEQAYADFPGDKDAFCEAYRANKDGIAGQIRSSADQSYFKEIGEYVHEIRSRDAAIGTLKQQVERLTRQLEREQEWKPYEDAVGVSQKDYEELETDCNTRKMTEEEAKGLISDWYGFEKQKIRIQHTAPVYEVNRHRRLRKVGEVRREPLYNAADWNYIRFRCMQLSYESYNDSLRLCTA